MTVPTIVEVGWGVGVTCVGVSVSACLGVKVAVAVGLFGCVACNVAVATDMAVSRDGSKGRQLASA